MQKSYNPVFGTRVEFFRAEDRKRWERGGSRGGAQSGLGRRRGKTGCRKVGKRSPAPDLILLNFNLSSLSGIKRNRWGMLTLNLADGT